MPELALPPPATLRRIALRAAVAIALVVAAASLRLWPLQGLGLRLAYLTFYPAVMIAALYGGLYTGLLATLLSALVIYFWQPAGLPFIQDSADWMGMAVFVINGIMIASVSEAMYRARARAAREAEIARQERDRAEAANRQTRQAMQALELRETELAQANERLQELDRAKTEFFSNVSHEFRTPLTLMLGPLEDLLQRGEALSPESRETLATVQRNAQRLLKLVNALLEFSRIEAGRVRISRIATDLATFTAELASNFESLCARAGLEFVVDCPPLSQAVSVDRGMWERIVLNLLSNAFKFTFAGRIEVRLRMHDGQAELSVGDSGIGIPASELPHLFERFHRVEGAHGRSYEGSGIGLALVQELAALHDGSVQVDSVEGRGSIFTVRIPCGAPSGDAPLPAMPTSDVRAYVEESEQWLPAPAQQPATPVIAARGRIVVADDSSDMRNYIRRLLEAAGFAVDAYPDGGPALAACRNEAPDLVLSDVMMPGMDGFTLLRHLRTDESTARIPVILLSARAGEEARVEGLAAGADEYIVKPFNARELVARIDGAVRLSRQRREAAEHENSIVTEANRTLRLEVEERKRAEARLSSYMVELQAANRELDSFAYAVSHDLRAPLRAMSGFTSALEEDYGDRLDGEAREFLDEIALASRRMGELIDGLLALSRSTRGKLEKEKVDLSVLAQEVLAELARAEPGRQVAWQVAPGLAAHGDRRMLEAALRNLLGNAWKYSAHAAQPTIRLYPEERNGRCAYCIADNGAGFDMAHAEKLFQPFQRLHRQDEFPGIGIGLATVQRVIHRHGGEIEAEAVPGQGATFCFTLPAEGGSTTEEFP